MLIDWIASFLQPPHLKFEMEQSKRETRQTRIPPTDKNDPEDTMRGGVCFSCQSFFQLWLVAAGIGTGPLTPSHPSFAFGKVQFPPPPHHFRGRSYITPRTYNGGKLVI